MLESIWFFLWGLLWAIFFMTDGFDLGIGTLYPILGNSEENKRVMINAMGPLWDGNQVWLITAGGVTFAAFPIVYAVMFSSLYTALMLILFGLIIRGVSFEFRGKLDGPLWKKTWDTSIFLGSFLPAFLFGVAFANIFRGIPIDADGILQGNVLTLFNPYGLLGGILFVLLFVMHGAIWLAIKSDADLHHNALRMARRVWPGLLITAVVFLAASMVATDLYRNYFAHPWMFAIVLLTVAGLVGSRWYLAKGALFKAWVGSALTIVGATFFGVAGLFPNLFPSSLDPAWSLTAFNAASSPLTLKIMLAVVVLFLPLVLAYQFWAYRLFNHRVNREELTY